MPAFKVARFQLGEATASSFHYVALDDPKDAAEWITGSNLSARGAADRLLARVWLRDEPDGEKWEFFVEPEPPAPKRRRR